MKFVGEAVTTLRRHPGAGRLVALVAVVMGAANLVSGASDAFWRAGLAQNAGSGTLLNLLSFALVGSGVLLVLVLVPGELFGSVSGRVRALLSWAVRVVAVGAAAVGVAVLTGSLVFGLVAGGVVAAGLLVRALRGSAGGGAPSSGEKRDLLTGRPGLFLLVMASALTGGVITAGGDGVDRESVDRHRGGGLWDRGECDRDGSRGERDPGPVPAGERAGVGVDGDQPDPRVGQHRGCAAGRGEFRRCGPGVAGRVDRCGAAESRPRPVAFGAAVLLWRRTATGPPSTPSSTPSAPGWRARLAARLGPVSRARMAGYVVAAVVAGAAGAAVALLLFSGPVGVWAAVVAAVVSPVLVMLLHQVWAHGPPWARSTIKVIAVLAVTAAVLTLAGSSASAHTATTGAASGHTTHEASVTPAGLVAAGVLLIARGLSWWRSRAWQRLVSRWSAAAEAGVVKTGKGVAAVDVLRLLVTAAVLVLTAGSASAAAGPVAVPAGGAGVTPLLVMVAAAAAVGALLRWMVRAVPARGPPASVVRGAVVAGPRAVFVLVRLVRALNGAGAIRAPTLGRLALRAAVVAGVVVAVLLGTAAPAAAATVVAAAQYVGPAQAAAILLVLGVFAGGVAWVIGALLVIRDGKLRFSRSDPIERAVLEEVADLEAMMSAIGPMGPGTRRAVRKLATRLQRHVYWAGGSEPSRHQDDGAWFSRRVFGTPAQIRFTEVVESIALDLEEALRRAGVALTAGEARLLAYRYVALHELGHVFQEAVRRTAKRDLGRQALKAGLSDRMRRTEGMSSVALENERFAEGAALAAFVRSIARRHPERADLEQTLLRLLTAEIAGGSSHGYDRPHPPVVLSRILELAERLEAAAAARRRAVARVVTVGLVAVGVVVAAAAPAAASTGGGVALAGGVVVAPVLVGAAVAVVAAVVVAAVVGWLAVVVRQRGSPLPAAATAARVWSAAVASWWWATGSIEPRQSRATYWSWLGAWARSGWQGGLEVFATALPRGAGKSLARAAAALVLVAAAVSALAAVPDEWSWARWVSGELAVVALVVVLKRRAVDKRRRAFAARELGWSVIRDARVPAAGAPVRASHVLQWVLHALLLSAGTGRLGARLSDLDAGRDVAGAGPGQAKLSAYLAGLPDRTAVDRIVRQLADAGLLRIERGADGWVLVPADVFAQLWARAPPELLGAMARNLPAVLGDAEIAGRSAKELSDAVQGALRDEIWDQAEVRPGLLARLPLWLRGGRGELRALFADVRAVSREIDRIASTVRGLRRQLVKRASAPDEERARLASEIEQLEQDVVDAREAERAAVLKARNAAAAAGFTRRDVAAATEAATLGSVRFMATLVGIYEAFVGQAPNMTATSSAEFAEHYDESAEWVTGQAAAGKAATAVAGLGVGLLGDRLIKNMVQFVAIGVIGAVALLVLGLPNAEYFLPATVLVGSLGTAGALARGRMDRMHPVEPEQKDARQERRESASRVVAFALPVAIAQGMAVVGVEVTMLALAVTAAALTAGLWFVLRGESPNAKPKAPPPVWSSLVGGVRQAVGTPAGLIRFVLSIHVLTALTGLYTTALGGAMIDQLLLVNDPTQSIATTATAVSVLITVRGLTIMYTTPQFLKLKPLIGRSGAIAKAIGRDVEVGPLEEARVLRGVTLLPSGLAIPAMVLVWVPGLWPLGLFLTAGAVVAAWARKPLIRWSEGTTGAALSNTAKALSVAIGGAISIFWLGGQVSAEAVNLRLALLTVPVVVVTAVVGHLVAKLHIGPLERPGRRAGDDRRERRNRRADREGTGCQGPGRRRLGTGALLAPGLDPGSAGVAGGWPPARPAAHRSTSRPRNARSWSSRSRARGRFESPGNPHPWG